MAPDYPRDLRVKFHGSPDRFAKMLALWQQPNPRSKPIAITPFAWRIHRFYRWLVIGYAGWPSWVKAGIYGIAVAVWVYVALAIVLV